MRVLVAPDKFRGTLSAAQAARAIAGGWRRERPDDEVVELPLADGGEGTLDVLIRALGGAFLRRRVTGPLGDPVEAVLGVVARPEGALGVVELARASGIGLVPERRRDSMRATTRGTGELVLAACREGANEVLVTLGGSASTDAGAGLASACGARLLGGDGRPIADGGRALLELARIDLRGLDPSVRAASIVAGVDVDNPLLGPLGAARVFAPQKGASPDQVSTLERALGHTAAVIERDVGLDVRGLAGGGAAGGTAAGLVAFLGARIRGGTDVVFAAAGFDRALEAADLVLTGEGRFDATSLRGKVAGTVLDRAARAGVAAAVVCGERATTVPGVTTTSLVDVVGRERALGDARRSLEEVAALVAREASSLSSGA